MSDKKRSNETEKVYYRDCGKGAVRDRAPWWRRVRIWPSQVYQRRRLADTLVVLNRLQIRGRVFDAACGSGWLLANLPAGSVGMDINPRHVAAAKKRAPKASVTMGDLEKLKFSASTFDWVLVMELFEHIPVHELVMSELWRVLKVGGYLAVSVPADHWLWQWRWLASDMYVTEPQCTTFDTKAIKKLFGKRAYEVVYEGRVAWGLNRLVVVKKLSKKVG